MKCYKCKGKGHVKKKHFVILNWPIAHILSFLGLLKIVETKPGFVQEVKICSNCNGTGIV